MTRSAITAAGVLIPAHDEAATVGACVRSVLTALDAAPGLGARAVCVLADRCTDDTAARARAAAAAHPAARRIRVQVGTGQIGAVQIGAVQIGAVQTGAVQTGAAEIGTVLPSTERTARSGATAPTVGAVRSLAARTVLAALGTAPEHTWLLSTDADGTVTPDWVRAHLGLAAAGADAVAGGVVLDLPGHPVPPGEPPWPEHPVYGANLGVRADAFTAVGGFPGLACGEDHGLVGRLRSAGYRVCPGAPGTVRTSARLRGRACGGLADLLRTTGEDLPVA